MTLNTKAVVAVLVVAVIVVAGIGYYALSNGGGGGDDPSTGDGVTDCHLWVYGNVNGDDYIDQNDIDLLERIIAGEAEEVLIVAYDGYSATGVSQKISLADANMDGVLDEKDVQYIRDTISYMERYSAAVNNGTLDSFDEEFTLHYNNCDNVASTVHLPVKTLVSMYFSNSEIVRLLEPSTASSRPTTRRSRSPPCFQSSRASRTSGTGRLSTPRRCSPPEPTPISLVPPAHTPSTSRRTSATP